MFTLQLATATLLSDAQQLDVTCEQLQQIRVEVSATIVQQPKPQLWLTYQIQLLAPSLAAQLSWPVWDQAQVNFIDYLWEQTCLECFIAGGSINNSDFIEKNKSTGYIEINASPNGRYALYQFDDYRTPSTLPPTPLRQTNGQTLAHINWHAPSLTIKNHPTFTAKPIASSTMLPDYHYECSFGIPLNQLPSSLFASSDSHDRFSSDDYIKLLHPCVILWFGEVDLYFAPNHASPPDFHQRRYWSRFNYQAALAK